MEHSSEAATILKKVWSIQSSSLYTPANPAKGQCGVTSLVIQDYLGGEILKTKLPGGWHFYNLISGERHDFTSSQFSETIMYEDLPSSREEAFLDTNEQQYAYLKEAFFKELRK